MVFVMFLIGALAVANTMLAANRHDLRLMLRRMRLSALDTRRILGLFRRILWQIGRDRP